jgi:hypothetical protein
MNRMEAISKMKEGEGTYLSERRAVIADKGKLYVICSDPVESTYGHITEFTKDEARGFKKAVEVML